MTAGEAVPASGATIAAVERDTGVSKDTLRVWERRYDFPRPDRDAHGERLYPREQVEQLRVIRRLLDAGRRPGQVVGLPMEELLHLSRQTSAVQPSGAAPLEASDPALQPLDAQIRACFDLVKQHDAPALRKRLAQSVAGLGLAGFVTSVVVPLNSLIGDAWMAGRLEIFEEHFYTESVTTVLRNSLSALPPHVAAAPRVLLTTFPQEAHGLGLLMAEAFFALNGCHCLSLGVQMPVPDIARAARAHGSQIVALSFSASLNPNEVLLGLADLRRQLPADTQIWAGGACPALRRRPLPGVHVLSGFDAIETQLQQGPLSGAA